MTNAQVPDVRTADTAAILTTALLTHNGQRLTPKEDAFIRLYILYSDVAKAAREAGYSVRDCYKNQDAQYLKKGLSLLEKDYIKDEIAWRSRELNSAAIADKEELMMYLTRVVRGEERDQFNLDCSIADKTTAAKELLRIWKELDSVDEKKGSAEVHLVLERR